MSDAPSAPGFWVTFLSPHGLEAALGGKRGGAPTWIGIDLQHGALETRDVAGLHRVARAAGLSTLVRVADSTATSIGRALDTGVEGVIVPSVSGVEETRDIVSRACPPPRGSRSMGTSRASLFGPGGYSAPADAHRTPVADVLPPPAPRAPLILPMVETASGLAECEAMAAVDGVSGLFVGPYDLAASLGESGVEAPAVIAAIERVREAASAAGKGFGLFSGHAGLSSRFRAAHWLGVTTDAAVLRAGLAHALGDR